MEWPQFVQAVGDDAEMAALVARAKEIMNSKQPYTKPQETMSGVKSVSLKVERSWIILSDKEVRRQLGVARLTKASMKSVPQMVVPCEDGSPGSEQVYVFKDPQSQFRRATLQVVWGTQHEEKEMKDVDTMWPGQGLHLQGHTFQKQAETSGVLSLLQREMAGHLRMIDFQQFVDSMQREDAEDPAVEEGPERVPVQGSEQNDAFEGVAAEAMSSQVAGTPSANSSKKKPNASEGLRRSGSIPSIVIADSEVEQSPNAGSAAASSVDGASAAASGDTGARMTN